MDNYYSSQEWRKLRRQVLKRDGYQCRVFACNVSGSKNLSVHHIVPRAEGGGDHVENLITLCHAHHDKIEVAGVRVVTLIEAWEDERESPLENVSSMILDGLLGGGRKKPNRASSQPIILPRKPKGHLCEASTVDALRTFRSGKTLAATAKALGFSPMFAATISGILAEKPGAISAAGEERLRQRLDLKTKQIMQIVRSPAIPADVRHVAIKKRTPPKRVVRQDTGRAVIKPRTGTTLHVGMSDIELFDAIAGVTRMRKAALFGEMVRFFATAHNLHFIKDSGDDRFWELYDAICDLLGFTGEKMPPPKMLAIVDILAQIGIAEDAREITSDTLRRWSDEIGMDGTPARNVFSKYERAHPAEDGEL